MDRSQASRLPSPLWGGVGGGGPSMTHRATPLPIPPPQGGREQTGASGKTECTTTQTSVEFA
jgi:hypothetical protein